MWPFKRKRPVAQELLVRMRQEFPLANAQPGRRPGGRDTVIWFSPPEGGRAWMTADSAALYLRAKEELL